MSTWKVSSVMVFLVASAGLTGCGRSASDSGEPEMGAEQISIQSSDDEHNHEGWWCNEHGVPEEVCTRCSPKLVADFKAKGDWCEQHDRPESQCFICHPEKEAEFVALYEAKYGTKPPSPTE